MVERVIVAVDGGRASDAALAWVIDRADDVEMRIELAAVEDAGTQLPTSMELYYRSALEDVLARSAAKIREFVPGADVAFRVRRGRPSEQLSIGSSDADILVVGTNRTPTLTGILHGTLSLSIAGNSRCPTVVVSADWKPIHGVVVAGWTTDGTSDAALEFGAREASRRGNRLTIVHATSSPDPRESQRRLLVGAADGVRREHPELKVTEVLEQGSAAVAIVRAAHHAELVVVGSRGRGAITDFFLGSVSHDVLLNMPAPVVVIPHDWSPR